MNIVESVRLFPEMDDEHERYLRIAGEFYGYPKCCTDFFIKNWGKGRSGFTDNQMKVASNNLGFIPCQCHAILINKGLPISSLLVNRVCNTPFPDDGKIEDLDYFYEHYDEMYNSKEVAFVTQPREKDCRTHKKKKKSAVSTAEG